MKTVLNKSDVAHYWAHQRQDNGRVSGGNFYFEGKTIYSYGSHFPIATLQDDNKVLMTTRGYSNTTSKHLYAVRSAISHKTIIWCYDPNQASDGIHSQNINHFEAVAKESAMKLPKSKKPEIYLSEIAGQKRLLMDYVEHFKLKPKAYKHLHYINIVTKDGAIIATEKEHKQILKDKKEREKANALRIAAQIEKEETTLLEWRKFTGQFKNAQVKPYIYALTGTFLRFNKASQQVETSKNIQIPVKMSERFYKWLKHQLTKGGCNGECEHKILGYDVDHVNSEGIKVGCHDVSWTEINAMAKKLKWK